MAKARAKIERAETGLYSVWMETPFKNAHRLGFLSEMEAKHFAVMFCARRWGREVYFG